MMYSWSLTPSGIREIAGIWKQSTEENVRMNNDERTMETTKITQ
jgi:hypothetical protein